MLEPVGQRQGDERGAAHEPADLGDDVPQPRPHADERRQRRAEDQPDGGDGGGVDDGDEPGAGGVAADDPVAEVAEVVQLGVEAGREDVPQLAGQAGPVEQRR